MLISLNISVFDNIFKFQSDLLFETCITIYVPEMLQKGSIIHIDEPYALTTTITCI